MRNEFDAVGSAAINLLKSLSPEIAASMTFFIISNLGGGDRAIIFIFPAGIWFGGRAIRYLLIRGKDHQNPVDFSDS